jgi:hypothetical protein
VKISRRQLKKILTEQIRRLLIENDPPLSSELQYILDAEAAGAGGGSPDWDLRQFADGIVFEAQGGGPFKDQFRMLAALDYLKRLVESEESLQYKLTAELRSGKDLTGKKEYLLYVFNDKTNKVLNIIINDGEGKVDLSNRP